MLYYKRPKGLERGKHNGDGKEKELGGKRSDHRNQPFTHQAHHQNRDRRAIALPSRCHYSRDIMKIKIDCRKTTRKEKIIGAIGLGVIVLLIILRMKGVI